MSGYPDRFNWLIYSRIPDSFGDVKPGEVLADGGPLWGRIDNVDSSTEERLSAKRQTQTATITLSQYVPVKPFDRLFDVEWSETWRIENVRRGNNEMICSVTRFWD